MSLYPAPPFITVSKSAKERVFLYLFQILLLFLLLPGSAWTQETTEAEGVAALGSNIAVSRERALDDALRRAVEQAIGLQIAAETFSSQYRIINDTILAKSSGYVRQYRILSEGQRGGLFRVKISAQVAVGNLRNDLQSMGLLQVLAERPSLMVLLSEEVVGRFGSAAGNNNFPALTRMDMGQTEATLVESFLQNGFRVVDRDTVKANLSRKKALHILNGDNRAAAAVGLQAGAQIVIVGRAISKTATARIRNSNLQSVQATVQARAIRSDDAAIISSHSVHRAKAHIDEMQGGALALEAAGRKLAALLITDIVSKWQEEVYGRKREVTLALSGMGSYQRLQIIKTFLQKNVQGVQAVHERFFTAGNGELMLDYSGKSSHIAAELALHQFSGFHLEANTVTPNRLDIQVVPNK